MAYARRTLAIVVLMLIFWIDLLAIPMYFIAKGRSYICDYSPLSMAICDYIAFGKWSWKFENDY
jgi:hypothetical protein